MIDCRQWFLVILFSLASALRGAPAPYAEADRPQFHFTPEKNWMNDPNGLVFDHGQFQMFYQYNPLGEQWGHMSWGHAASSDLVHWKHLPLAMTEADGVMIFSGSAVIDWKNTSGFGRNGQPPLVAIYTGFRDSDNRQFQCIAYSNDRGLTWAKYSGNPVIDLGMTEFRDPKVQWSESAGCWLMVVALSGEHKVRFYHSANLKEWKLAGEFGPAGATGGVWECPDLVPLRVIGNVRGQKWVLLVNLSGGAPAGQSGTQYFVGDFDGAHFVPDADSVFALAPASVPQGRVFADFEGATYGDWQATGNAFGSGPAQGAFPGQNPVAGYSGRRLVNSFVGGDASTGTLTSPSFVITNAYISFLIGGGSHAGMTCMNLLVDGKPVRTAVGRDVENLDWTSWDVRDFQGQSAQLQIIDRDTGGWGHINVDQIIFADTPAVPSYQPALWLDHGADLYATASWNDIPKADGRRILIGWINHWPDGLPDVSWRGAMSVPRELSLRRTPADIRLYQEPVRELKELRERRFQFKGGDVAAVNAWLKKNNISGRQLELTVDFKPLNRGIEGVKVLQGPNQETLIGVDGATGRVFVDRARREGSSPSAAAQYAPLARPDRAVKLHIFVDACTLEVFVNDGEQTFTDLVFPPADSRGVEVFGPEPDAKITALSVWPLQSIWK